MDWFIGRGRKIKLPDEKNTMDMATQDIPLPKIVNIQLATYGVTGAEPLVKKGDRVKVGTKLVEGMGAMGVPVYSSVSGTVKNIDDMTTALGHRSPYITIEVDGNEEEEFTPPKIDDRESFIKAVRESGVVGLGGAGFPTFKKLSTGDKKVKYLLVNAAECEPFITSDYREMIEHTDRVIRGLKNIIKYIEAEKTIICIEDNKPKAIEILNEKIKDDSNISVKVVKTAYPGGAEKMVMLHTIGTMPAPGQIPIDIGAVVINISTISRIERYIEQGRPIARKRITVDGEGVEKPGNYYVPIGTPVSHLLEYCGVKSPKVILMGGPMMGIALPSEDYPILLNNNGILAFSNIEAYKEKNCIRCGKCASVCPMYLLPAAIDRAVRAENTDALKKENVTSCMECGCCAFVCPAHRHLVQTNKIGKSMLRKKGV